MDIDDDIPPFNVFEQDEGEEKLMLLDEFEDSDKLFGVTHTSFDRPHIPITLIELLREQSADPACQAICTRPNREEVLPFAHDEN